MLREYQGRMKWGRATPGPELHEDGCFAPENLVRSIVLRGAPPARALGKPAGESGPERGTG